MSSLSPAEKNVNLHSFPSLLQRWSVLKLEIRTRKGRLYLFTHFFPVYQLQKTLHCIGQKEISGIRVSEDCWPHYVYIFLLTFPRHSKETKKPLPELVSYLCSCYFIPEQSFFKWTNYSSLKAVQKPHLKDYTSIHCEPSVVYLHHILYL